MQTVEELAASIRRRRLDLGLTQATLAARAEVSLATVQNIEAARANPALATLARILEPLGLAVDVRLAAASWDVLADGGVPVTALSSRGTEGALDELPLHVLRAMRELAQAGRQGEGRRRDALQAWLLALHTHYPSRYRDWFGDYPEVDALVPDSPSNRVLKLTRIAKERLAERM